MAPKSLVFRFDDIEVREREYVLVKAGLASPVEPKAFRVLLILLRNPQKLIPKEELLNAVWGNLAVTENSLTRSIALLRRQLGDDSHSPSYIETVATVGYRFLCPVEASEDGLQTSMPTGETGTGGADKASEATLPTAHLAGVSNGVAKEMNRRKTWRRFWPWVLGGGLTVTAAGALLLFPGSPLRAPRFTGYAPITHDGDLGSIAWGHVGRVPAISSMIRMTNDRKAKIPINGLVTDGVRLYFIEGNPRASGSRIAQVSATGGETTWITTTLNEALAVNDISPDKSKLMVVHVGDQDSDEFWIQPLPAGTPHRIGSLKASSVTWTPDGEHIIYCWQRKVWIANEDGSDPHLLVEIPGRGRWFRFSPDGRLIRFSLLQEEGNASSIWEMNADGTNLHQLLPGWKGAPDQCCGRWSPDGDYYYFLTGAFFLGGGGPEQAIWVIPERHSRFRRDNTPERLTNGPLRFGAPTPSADGKSLFTVGDESRVELFSYDPKAQRFDTYLGGISAGPIAFSPDGKWVAYTSYPEMTLWKSRTDLSEKMQLTFPPVREYGARWSPDGTQLAFADVQFHRPWKAYVVSASGGDSPRQIAPSNADDVDTDPTWTPDGKSIVFSRLGAGGEGEEAIYRVDLRSGNLAMIPGSNGLRSPRLSPDGRHISAFTRNAKKLMLFDQNSWSILAEGEHFGFNEWSPDGKYVYVGKSGGGFGRIVRFRIKDRVSEDVLSLKDFPQLIDPFASWYGLTADGKILLMRDRSVQEIYALTLERK
jgi:Tol biopolymer transport system component/DNA-binding winged helix-turn-helix (wHTH) protein